MFDLEKIKKRLDDGKWITVSGYKQLVAEVERLHGERQLMADWILKLEKTAQRRFMLLDRMEWISECYFCFRSVGEDHASNCELAREIGQ